MPENTDNTISKSLRSLRGGMSERTAMICAAIFTGLSAGFLAYLLKIAIHYISTGAKLALGDDHNWYLLVLPVVGITAALAYTLFIARKPLAHGTEQVRTALRNDNPALDSGLIFDPLIANAITLGSGCSAGAEGPMAYAGAALGNNYGKLMGLSPQSVRLLVAIGAGAGIAAIFRAPIGGALFTIEVLAFEMTTFPVMILIGATLLAGLTAYLLHGFNFAIDFIPPSSFMDTSWLAPTVGLGIFCALYGIFYNWSGDLVSRLLGKISNVWRRAIVAGVLMGALLFLFPALYGEGYPAIVDVLHGDALRMTEGFPRGDLLSSHTIIIIVAAAIILVKGCVTSATNNGGGVAGIFAPTLFAGCIAGFLFAVILNMFPGVSLSTYEYACIGMGAVMASTIRAPFMAVFLTSEMTGNFQLLMPTAIASFLAYFIATRLAPSLRA